ncbi:MAG TPA: hypothetical protein VEF33_10360 [Syntrophales bacterium]|nr:hypothetical protein [Syntrophales bacterium]
MISFYAAYRHRDGIRCVQLLVTVDKGRTISKKETGVIYANATEAGKDISKLNTIKNLMILNSESLT